MVLVVVKNSVSSACSLLVHNLITVMGFMLSMNAMIMEYDNAYLCTMYNYGI